MQSINQNTIDYNAYGLSKFSLKNFHAFMGLSICSRFYSKKNILRILNWAENEFRNLLFLIADEPQAYTFIASKGLSYNKAMQKAKEIGEIKYQTISKLIKCNNIQKTKVIFWKEIANSEMYSKIYKQVKYIYDNDDLFKKDIFAQIFERNKSLPTEFEFAKINLNDFENASLYVISELAAIIYLQCYSNPLYPIQIFHLPIPKALSRLYTDSYNYKLNLSLKNIGYIELKMTDLKNLI